MCAYLSRATTDIVITPAFAQYRTCQMDNHATLQKRDAARVAFSHRAELTRFERVVRNARRRGGCSRPFRAIPLQRELRESNVLRTYIGHSLPLQHILRIRIRGPPLLATRDIASQFVNRARKNPTDIASIYEVFRGPKDSPLSTTKKGNRQCLQRTILIQSQRVKRKLPKSRQFTIWCKRSCN